ncbi:MAG: RNA 2',3'-cyclic phosphodiesterase [Salinivirgaceae bacterium]|nr:RNA 2',3'-cyclic phosphodiesterase [Salinivirgaceae bacterium]
MTPRFQRIFIAVRFTPEFCDALQETQQRLQQRGVRGTYCSRQNLHLTLAFVGETTQIDAIRAAVSRIQFTPFDIATSKLGVFGNSSKVIWAGIEGEQLVESIANQLRAELEANGVKFDSRPFKAHVSLLRQPSLLITNVEVPRATMTVTHISIMKSERINGQLIYTEI